MKMKRINIGLEVKSKVEEAGLSKAKFAELLGIARQNIDKTVFQKHSLDTDLLCNISEVLNCNFFDYYKSEEQCNHFNYNCKKEIKATLSIELGTERKEQVFRFVFGNNNIEIREKEEDLK